MEEFAQYDAVGLAELIRRKEVTPLELVEEVIDRIERVNPTLNGVTIKMYEHARELAQGDIGNGPLAGVPFLLKDFLAEYAGVEYSASSRFLQGFVPDRDTELVKRFKAGGFITVAKTNLPEFAIGATTEPRLRGATHNPWDTSRTPGRFQRRGRVRWSLPGWYRWRTATTREGRFGFRRRRAGRLV